jgi:hypothetical protein
MAEDDDPDTEREDGSQQANGPDQASSNEHRDEDEQSVPLSELREDVAGPREEDAGHREKDAELRGDHAIDPGRAGDGSEASDAPERPDAAQPAGESAPGDDPDGDTADEDGPTKIPLSELKDDLAEREPAETDEALFHREAVDEVEAEAVWAELLMGEGDTSQAFEPTGVETIGERDVQIVPTTLCHRCEYFGEPPELHCTHEGTTIHETVDMDHYRVSHCPMVEDSDGPEQVE